MEDALSGVEAGQQGGFGLVIGVDRNNRAGQLRARGAHVVVKDLSQVSAGRWSGQDSGWEHVYTGFDPEDEGKRETLCAMGNGYFVTRGTALEAIADEVHYPGTYLAGCYNRLKTNIQGRIVENEDLVNIPNWRCLNFRIGKDPWFSLKDVTLIFYRQSLDMKKGILNRDLSFRDERGRLTLLSQISFVHGEQMHLAGMKMELTPLNWGGEVVICSALDGRVTNRGVERYKDLENRHLDLVEARHVDDQTVALKVRTRNSGIDIALGAYTHVFVGSKRVKVEPLPVNKPYGYIGKYFRVKVGRSDRLVVEKQVSVYTSKDSGIYECLWEAQAAVSTFKTKFTTLLNSHVTAWSLLWREFDFNISLDNARLEQSTGKITRLYMFHLLQSSSFHSLDIDVGMLARGWHGEGYRGHVSLAERKQRA
ncbi:MAG: hypothetical protein HUN05_04485 [Desulfobacter sp.]|nr:MAG: hypothetical protein HUN05_04485 [Desulfobacter sp.]